MTRSMWIYFGLCVAALLPCQAAFASKVLLRCGGATTCYYTFFIGSAVHNWTLQGGAQYSYNGVKPGDQYCQSSTGPNDPATCRRFTLTADMLSD